MLDLLQKNGLVLNKGKCQFFRSEVEFLGLKVTASGVAPLSDQISVVADFPQPATIKELQAFLGAVNFYHRFIPAVTKILLPLTAVLKGGRKGAELLEWSTNMLAAFQSIKRALLLSVCLAFPRDNTELLLATDTSGTHVGAVLQQLEPLSQEWQPLGFFSAKLEKAQLSYSAFDRELFVVYAAVSHFRHHLEGRRFIIWTDHKPLTLALSRVSDLWTARQQRQLSYVAEFTSLIKHVPGCLNIVADLMSRPPQAVPASGPARVAGVKAHSGSLAATQTAGRTTGASPPSTPSTTAVTAVTAVDFNLPAIALAQKSCDSIRQLQSRPSLNLQDFPIGTSTICCDVSGGG